MNIKESNIHWNYYLAIENDLETVSRFIEFNNDNLGAYSIELAHIFLSASSEIDVILKQLCNIVYPDKNCDRINQYRKIIREYIPELIEEQVYVNRFGLEFTPWLFWKEDKNPNWWQSHQLVKHRRNDYFKEANLQNTLNAVGALLIVVTYYYKYVIQQRYLNKKTNVKIDLLKTTEHLNPKSELLKLKSDYYKYPIYFQ